MAPTDWHKTAPGLWKNLRDEVRKAVCELRNFMHRNLRSAQQNALLRPSLLHPFEPLGRRAPASAIRSWGDPSGGGAMVRDLGSRACAQPAAEAGFSRAMRPAVTSAGPCRGGRSPMPAPIAR